MFAFSSRGEAKEMVKSYMRLMVSLNSYPGILKEATKSRSYWMYCDFKPEELL